MSSLTQASRDKLPRADYVDQRRRLFPVIDQEDADRLPAHLAGVADSDKLKARALAMLKAKKLAVPKEWAASGAAFADDTVAADSGFTGDYLLIAGDGGSDFATELSHSEIRSLIDNLMNPPDSANPYRYWVRDVYDSYFVYRDGDTNKLFSCDYTVAADQTIKMGKKQQVVEKRSYEIVTMSAVAFGATAAPAYTDEEKGIVYRYGRLFEAGEYPDKNFTLTPEEMLQACGAFAPCPIDLEHRPTVLSGKLGRLETIELGNDGKTLFGLVGLPQWLDTVLGADDRKVSASWDRPSKTLQGLALVTTPRVSSAALMAAFQDGGAVPAKRRGIMPTLAELKAMLQEFVSGTGADEQIAADPDVAAVAPPVAAPPAAMRASAAPVPPVPASQTGFSAAEQAEFRALLEQNRSLTAEMAVRGAISAGYLTPADFDAACVDYLDAVRNDAVSPANFGTATAPINRVDRLKSHWQARGKNNLTRQRLPGAMLDESRADFVSGHDVVAEMTKLFEETRQAALTEKGYDANGNKIGK